MEVEDLIKGNPYQLLHHHVQEWLSKQKLETHWRLAAKINYVIKKDANKHASII